MIQNWILIKEKKYLIIYLNYYNAKNNNNINKTILSFYKS